MKSKLEELSKFEELIDNNILNIVFNTNIIKGLVENLNSDLWLVKFNEIESLLYSMCIRLITVSFRLYYENNTKNGIKPYNDIAINVELHRDNNFKFICKQIIEKFEF